MRVKIILEDGESELDAANSLQKALEFHSSGAAHDDESFDDPAMVDMARKMEEIHSRIYTDMIREINELLDEEYSNGSI